MYSHFLFYSFLNFDRNKMKGTIQLVLLFLKNNHWSWKIFSRREKVLQFLGLNLALMDWNFCSRSQVLAKTLQEIREDVDGQLLLQLRQALRLGDTPVQPSVALLRRYTARGVHPLRQTHETHLGHKSALVQRSRDNQESLLTRQRFRGIQKLRFGVKRFSGETVIFFPSYFICWYASSVV